MSRLAISAVLVGVLAATTSAQEGPGGEQAAFLGVFGESITADSGQQGAVIREVIVDSPAAKARLQTGDVVLKVDDKSIDGFRDLVRVIEQKQPGQKVKFQILRSGKEQTVEVELGSRPALPARPRSPFDLVPEGFQFQMPPGVQPPFEFPEAQRQAPRPMIGIQMQAVSDDLRRQLKLGDQNGVIVADVLPNSPAAKAGLQTTDLITKADDKPIESPEDLQELVTAKNAGDEIKLEIFRDGETMEKTLKLEAMTPRQRMPRGFRFPDATPDQFRQYFAPGERVRAMEERIEKLEEQLKQLQQTIEKLQQAEK